MPVDTPHRLYTKILPQWSRCRDAHGGSDAVKAKTTTYLPMLEGQTSLQSNSYVGYLRRALFYPATARTVAGLAGLTFAKPPTVAGVPTTAQNEFNDVTLSGQSMGAFGLSLCQEVLITGRVGTLIDYPTTPGATNRPYWVSFTAESILNWRLQRINGKLTLTRVVLVESIEEETDDPFAPKTILQYRVLELIDGFYAVTLYRQNKDDQAKFDQQPSTTPLRKGERLTFIPFVFCNPSNIEPDVQHPPLIDLVDVNLSHYCTSADHEHGAHWTALPTPVITGHKLPEGTELAVGSGTAWVLENPAATATMLEFSGAGLASLATLKDEKRLLMATLGARMLETQKNAAEAAQTVRMRHAGESSAMSVMADAIGQALTQALRWHLWWGGMETTTADKALVTMNPDVMDELSADDIRVLVETWQKKGISKETLYYNLTWGEWTRPGVTFAEEEASIAKETPPAPEPAPPKPVITKVVRDETGKIVATETGGAA